MGGGNVEYDAISWKRRLFAKSSSPMDFFLYKCYVIHQRIYGVFFGVYSGAKDFCAQKTSSLGSKKKKKKKETSGAVVVVFVAARSNVMDSRTRRRHACSEDLLGELGLCMSW